jgi:hypothetical protein
MKVRYVHTKKIDPHVERIYSLVLKHGWKIKVTARDKGVIFVRAKSGKHQHRDLILYPSGRTVERKGHGCAL